MELDSIFVKNYKSGIGREQAFVGVSNLKLFTIP